MTMAGETTGKCALEEAYTQERTRLFSLATKDDPQGEYFKPVFGEGKPGAQILLIGEAPGAEETKLGHPFVQQFRHPGEAVSEQPIDPGSRPDKPWMKTETFFDGGEEADFLNLGRIVLDQMVATLAKITHQTEIMALQIFDAPPRQIARLLTGKAGKVAPVNQGDSRALAGKRGSRDGAIDTATNHQDIVQFLIKTIGLMFILLPIALLLSAFLPW